MSRMKDLAIDQTNNRRRRPKLTPKQFVLYIMLWMGCAGFVYGLLLIFFTALQALAIICGIVAVVVIAFISYAWYCIYQLYKMEDPQ